MIENEIKLFINENVKPYTRWKGTCMEGYHNLSNKKKGDLGEKIVSDLMVRSNVLVLPSNKGYNGTDDRYIGGYDTEIKFSLSQKNDDEFMINHVKKDIKWERFIFYGWNLIKPHKVYWCTRKDMELCWKGTNWWGNQSSDAEKMLTGKNLIKWLNSPFVREMSEWDSECKVYNGLEDFYGN